MAGYFFYVQFLFLGILSLLIVVDGRKKCNEVGNDAVFKCDCQIKMDCREEPKYTNAKILRDLAPKGFGIKVTGKRYRKKKFNPLPLCKEICKARVALFLRFDGVDYNPVDASDKNAEMRFNQQGGDILCNYAVKRKELTASAEPEHLTTPRKCGFWYSYGVSPKACVLSGKGFDKMQNTGEEIGCWVVGLDNPVTNIGLANFKDTGTGSYNDRDGMDNSLGVVLDDSATPLVTFSALADPYVSPCV